MKKRFLCSSGMEKCWISTQATHKNKLKFILPKLNLYTLSYMYSICLEDSSIELSVAIAKAQIFWSFFIVELSRFFSLALSSKCSSLLKWIRFSDFANSILIELKYYKKNAEWESRNKNEDFKWFPIGWIFFCGFFGSWKK